MIMASHTRMVSSSALLVIFMVVSMPLVYSSSRPRFIIENVPLSSSMEMSDGEHGRFGIGGGGGRASAALDMEMEDSAREVPTGPDPLHHNHSPIKIPRKKDIINHP